MANISIIMGKSGTGKSTSIRNLDPKTTYVINVLGKRLPFKGSSNIYNESNGNYKQVKNYPEMMSALHDVQGDMSKKVLILDDVLFLMRNENFAKATESGYGKFTVLAKNFQQMIEACTKMRSDLAIFMVMHPEDEVSDGSIIGYKVSLCGKMVEQSYNPVEVVPMVLFSSSEQLQDGSMQYVFYTNRTKVGNISIPAKSPMGMFEDITIPNDLSIVVKAMHDYYDGDAELDTYGQVEIEDDVQEQEPKQEQKKEPKKEPTKLEVAELKAKLLKCETPNEANEFVKKYEINLTSAEWVDTFKLMKAKFAKK